MNKKIKIIDLVNRIESGEKVPEKIKYNQLEFKYDKGSGKYFRKNSSIITWFCIERFTNDFLNKTVEILEDNTEEIEELEKEQEAIANPKTMLQEIRFYYDSNKMGDKINEIIRYIKRKDKNND